MKLVIGHCQSGSLTGAVASKKVTEAFKGSLRMVGNHSKSTKAKASLTARHTGRAETKVGLSDPVVPSGRAIAQRIKATPGITGLSPPRVHIDGEVWQEARELGSERRETVRSLSSVGVRNLRGSVPSTRGPGWTHQWCTSCKAICIAG